jgi:hypothetical protein
MGKLTFYRQVRADGGIRMGLDVDDDSLAHHFEPGPDDDDPRLLWFIDIRCQGKKVPTTFDDGADWLRENSKRIKSALSDLANELAPGIDSDIVPGRTMVPGMPPGAKIEIVFTATKRVLARDMAKHLREFRDHFEDYLDTLKPVHA